MPIAEEQQIVTELQPSNERTLPQLVRNFFEPEFVSLRKNNPIIASPENPVLPQEGYLTRTVTAVLRDSLEVPCSFEQNKRHFKIQTDEEITVNIEELRERLTANINILMYLSLAEAAGQLEAAKAKIPPDQIHIIDTYEELCSPYRESPDGSQRTVESDKTPIYTPYRILYILLEPYAQEYIQKNFVNTDSEDFIAGYAKEHGLAIEVAKAAFGSIKFRKVPDLRCFFSSSAADMAEGVDLWISESTKIPGGIDLKHGLYEVTTSHIEHNGPNTVQNVDPNLTLSQYSFEHSTYWTNVAIHLGMKEKDLPDIHELLEKGPQLLAAVDEGPALLADFLIHRLSKKDTPLKRRQAPDVMLAAALHYLFPPQ